ncbi:MAG: hypothetical protein V4757_07080 [Pseudomonadota bacterium]
MNNAVILGFGASILGSSAMSSSQKKKAERKAREQYNASQVDRLVNSRSTTGAWELVLGRVRKGGNIIFEASTGANKTTFVQVIPLAAHAIDGIEEYYLNDEVVTVDGSGNVTSAPYAISNRVSASVFRLPNGTWVVSEPYGAATPISPPVAAGAGTIAITLPHTPIAGSVSAFTGTTSGPEGDIAQVPVTVVGNVVTTAEGATVNYQHWESVSRVNLRLVNATGVADARMQALFPGVWTGSFTVSGHAYLIAEYTYDETAFPTGLPNVTVLMRGARVYDPRTGLTAWSQNPALLMRHVYQHAYFGKATPTAAEDTRLIAAANACDTSTAWPTGAAALYRANTVIPFGTAARDALDDLAQAMAGMWAYGGGEMYVRAGVWTSPVIHLQEPDLATIVRDASGSETMHAIEIGTHRPRAEKFNTVNIQIWDEAQGYKQVPLPPLVGAALVARDGKPLAQQISYPAIGFAPQAWHVASIMMRDARDPETVVISFKKRAYPVELLDVIQLSIPRYGWSAKTYIVLGREWTIDGNLSLTLKATTAAIFAMGAAFVPGGYAANTNLPKPWNLAAVSITSVTSASSELLVQSDGTIVSRMRVLWAAISDESVRQGGSVEVQYRAATATEWQTAATNGGDTQLLIAGVRDRGWYILRARARSSLAVGPWGPQVVHQVIGKTEPPGNVAALMIEGPRLTWTSVTDVDLAGYRLKFHYGSNRDWGTAIPLNSGVLTNSPYTMQVVPTGPVTIMVRAVDTSGNESRDSAYVFANLGDALVANVVEDIDYRALVWPGSTTGILDSGDLLATQGDPFYGPDAGLFYDLDGAAFYTSNFDAFEWVSSPWTPTLAAAGSTMTIAWTLTGDAMQVQYRQTGPNPFWDDDLGAFYGDDSDIFYEGSPDFQPWPGSIVAENQEYQFRVVTTVGTTEGRLSEFTVSVDVPDKTLVLNNVAISPGGSRLSGAVGQFTVIENILLTLRGTGTAITARASDYGNPAGPLVTALDTTNTSVSASIDAQLQGH